MRKILIISTMPTHPTDAGNRAAIMAQVHILQKMGHEVHFLFASMELSHSVDYDAMKKYWGEKLHIFTMYKILKMKRVFMDLWRKKINHNYWKVDDHYPWGLANYVNKLNQKENFDACIIQYYRLSRLLPSITIPRKAIFTHDVFAYKDIRIGNAFYETLNAHEEAKAMQRCPTIFAIQKDEAAYFRTISPRSKVYTVYNPYQTHQSQYTDNKALLYLASRMEFNVTGIQFFLDKVWPTLSKKIPDIKLMIGGSVCEKIHSEYDNVSLLGKIDKLEDFYALGNIVINPVYQGTGLKIKTFEALSFGKATVVHPHSMTGIYKPEVAPLLKASTTEEWIDVISDLINSPHHIEELMHQSIFYIENMNEYIQLQYEDFLKN